ncbi:MAG: potassium uptake protein, TrkH family [Oscillospiraceae bacterium]|nr:potassium uptake protein, TrkH family [Oscillospiraceae bacterium]
MIVLTFLGLILLGAVLLTLPVASRSGESAGFLTALFTATSSTCVTGLVLADTYVQWSSFGQVVIICLIQVGGLGFMSMISVFFFLLHRKIGLKQRLIMAQGFSLNDVDGVVKLVRTVLIWTAVIELAGALILALRFWPEYGWSRAVKWGVFHSISAFCNAGFDIFGELQPGSSLGLFVRDPVVNLTIIALIVIGGLGFYVWTELGKRFRGGRFSVHTKLVLVITVVLLVGGTVLFACLEWDNGDTIGGFSAGDKLLAAAFQSATCRTAGFAALDQGALTESSKALSTLLMLIGGSAGSTAGGIKTVTVGILFLSVLSAARGRSRLTIFGRSISGDQIRQAMTVMGLMLMLSFFGGMFLSAANGLPFLDCLYETASALGTAGLSTGLTPLVGTASRLLLIVFMFFGRVGVMTISFGFLLGDPAEERFQYAETKVLIG